MVAGAHYHLFVVIGRLDCFYVRLSHCTVHIYLILRHRSKKTVYKIINKKKLYAAMLADFIGGILFFPRQLFRGREEIDADRIREILLIRTAYIGDVMMTLPVLKPLRERFREARMSLLTSPGGAEIAKRNPYVDEIIPYNPFWFYPSGIGAYLKFVNAIRGRRFDLVIEARGDIRDILFLVWPLKATHKVSYDVGGGGYLLTRVVPYGGLKHKVEYHLDIVKHLGCDAGQAEWGVYLGADEQRKVGEILQGSGISGPFIALHPGARLPLKRWLPERYAAVCDHLIKGQGLPVILLGAKEERALVDEVVGAMRQGPYVNLAGTLGLRELAGIISRSSLFICNDSAPMHIASSMKIPTVAIFGPSKSVETGPYGNSHRVVERDFSCRSGCDEKRCRHTRFKACMNDIQVSDVLDAALELLREAA